MTGEAEGDTPAPEAAAAEAEAAELPVADVIKSLVHFLANRPTLMPLWQYEDITAKGLIFLPTFFSPVSVATPVFRHALSGRCGPPVPF